MTKMGQPAPATSLLFCLTVPYSKPTNVIIALDFFFLPPLHHVICQTMQIGPT